MTICANPGCSNNRRLGKNGEYKLHCSPGCCAKHNASKSAEKRKETNKIKYGTEYPIAAKSTRAKIRKTVQDKYGVENVSQVDSVKQKKKDTTYTNYGVIHPLQSAVIKDRVKDTLNEKYGVDHVSYIGMSQTQIDILTNVDKIQELNQTYNLYSIGKQYGFSDRTLREILDKNSIEPIKHLRSSFEAEVMAYIVTIYKGVVKPGHRIGKKEIDIFIPELNIGVECNGAYWHSETSGNRDKNYHVDKLDLVSSHGISLLQIWDFEWYAKNDIIKSMISHKLHNSTRLFGRRTSVVRLNKNDEREFFSKTHIQGFTGSQVCYGLQHNGDIVSAMSFGKPRYNTDAQWELIRFSNALHTTVVGGASKLYNEFIKNYTPDNVISYSHRHIGTGNVYKNMGFSYLKTTNPSYKYTKDYVTMHSRVTFQKHKLPLLFDKIDMSLPEWENMKVNGYDRIWDCGNDVWTWSKV